MTHSTIPFNQKVWPVDKSKFARKHKSCVNQHNCKGPGCVIFGKGRMKRVNNKPQKEVQQVLEEVEA